MKLYRLDYTTIDGNYNATEWLGTQAAANARYKELVKIHERFNVDKPQLVEIPTDKPSLLVWLNSNCNTDNG